MIGQTISHYKILEKLGEGGMGEVYLAEDISLGRKVAVKFLSSDKAADPESRQRFVHEARAQAMLSHPNIATFYEVGEEADKVYIVMEYIEGQPLSNLAQFEKFSLAEILDIAIQIGEGLQAAHEKGIIHRDIKPENVLVTAKHHAKITDFGLAKWKGASTLTQTGARMGTAYYMSPEQVEGKKVDHRTDIFSLGTILYELLCARRPFEGETDTAIFYDLINTSPQPLARYSRDVPNELERTVMKCLAKRPEERYQHIDELLVDLRSVKKKLETGSPAAEVSKIALSPSIAVLPFTNMSPEPENEYFSDGLTEEIIAQLAKIRALKVISRTSVMRYKQTAKSLKLIATELGVRHILEGSVRKQGNHLRITAQLVDALEDAHLWAETYQGTVEDVFYIQERVACEIAEALKLKLSPQEQRNLEKRQTENTEAYQLYLKGRFFWNKRTEEGLKKGIEYFEQAIEKDPAYALAYTGLADSYIILTAYSFIAPNEAVPRIRAAVLKALEIDAMLAEAHISQALSRCFDWDWGAAEREFKLGIELNPNYATGHHWYAIFLTVMGRFDEAVTVIKRALKLDPFSLIINTDAGRWVNYFGRQYDQDINQLQKTLEMDANFAMAHYHLALAYNETGRYAEAMIECQKAQQLTGGWPEITAALGYSQALAGNRKESERTLEELKEVLNRRYVSSYSIALIYLVLGDKEGALEWLEKGYQERAFYMVLLKVDPRLDALRTDPRFIALFQKMGFDK